MKAEGSQSEEDAAESLAQSMNSKKGDTLDHPKQPWLDSMRLRFIRYLSLIILVTQNTLLVLGMRYSRTHYEGKVYIASTSVFLAEVLKFVSCLCVVVYINHFDVPGTMKLLYKEIIVKWWDTSKLAVPCILYTIQNNLLFIALSHLNAATFQVTYQLKILTTALFSVFLLNRSLNAIKWIALVILTVGVALVQWPSGDSKNNPTGGFTSQLIGLGAVLMACVSSGFTGVYIEKILKQTETSMWIRNIQLSLMSFGTCLFAVFVTDGKAVIYDGFFQGYNSLVIFLIFLQALGGITIAVVMKYADNILKGFATSISIVTSSLVSFYFLHDFVPSWTFFIGTVLLLCAVFMYSRPSPPAPSLLPVTQHKENRITKL